MGAAKPCLGYPSRTAAVMALASEGLTDRQIAARTDLPVQTVAALHCSGRRTARHGDRSQALLALPPAVCDALYKPAIRRGIAVNALALRVLAVIVADDMIDAVLDDGGEL